MVAALALAFTFIPPASLARPRPPAQSLYHQSVTLTVGGGQSRKVTDEGKLCDLIRLFRQVSLLSLSLSTLTYSPSAILSFWSRLFHLKAVPCLPFCSACSQLTSLRGTPAEDKSTCTLTSNLYPKPIIQLLILIAT